MACRALPQLDTVKTKFDQVISTANKDYLVPGNSTKNWLTMFLTLLFEQFSDVAIKN